MMSAIKNRKQTVGLQNCSPHVETVLDCYVK